MAYNPTVLSQLLQSISRLEFEKLAQKHDGPRRSDALSRWSQFIALSVGHLGQRHSLRDIEAALASDARLHYHLGSRAVSR
jgi:putative transposase